MITFLSDPIAITVATRNGNWAEIDVGPNGLGYIPARATAVFLSVYTGSGNNTFDCQTVDDVPSTNTSTLIMQSQFGVNHWAQRVVALNNGKFKFAMNHASAVVSLFAWSDSPFWRTQKLRISRQAAAEYFSQFFGADIGLFPAVSGSTLCPIFFGTAYQTTSSLNFGMRPYGSSINNYTSESLYGSASNFLAVPLANCGLEYKFASSGFQLWLDGFDFGYAVDPPYEFTVGGSGWQAIDLTASGMPSDVTGVVVECLNQDITVKMVAVRGYGWNNNADKLRNGCKIHQLARVYNRTIYAQADNYSDPSKYKFRVLAYFRNDQPLFAGAAGISLLGIGGDHSTLSVARKRLYLEMEL